jgi:hypothetical protein
LRGAALPHTPKRRWARPVLSLEGHWELLLAPAVATPPLVKRGHCPVFRELIRVPSVKPSMLWRISVLFVSAVLGACAQPAIPDTPAGRTLKAWLEAFNSGERARLEAYIQKFDPTRPIDNQMSFRSQTGGFDLLSIEKSERTYIQFRVKEKNSPTGVTTEFVQYRALSSFSREFLI